MSQENPVHIGLNEAELILEPIRLKHSNPEEMMENVKVLIEIHGLVSGTLEQIKEDEAKDVEGEL